MDNNTLYDIAFSMLTHVSLQDKHRLLQTIGSAEGIYRMRNTLREAIPDASERLQREVMQMEGNLRRAEDELRFIENGHIQPLSVTSDDYPTRLKSCPDAPTLLYHYGNTPLNATRVVSIVGTRQITPYGKELCATFVKELSQLLPETLIVSGLAYGVDIHSHRAAVENGLPTVGVVAHGLDQIYPRMHRDTAIAMARNGGLLTEYPSGTAIDRRNFVERNRIVAGMCDALVVVESADKGGSLITAALACDYAREVFAFPGRTTDKYSEGCNRLIRNQQAQLVTTAESFVRQMGWNTETERQQALSAGIQQDMFPSLTSDEQNIMNVLKPTDGTSINSLAITTGINISTLSSLLFGMEMKGLVVKLGANNYRKAH